MPKMSGPVMRLQVSDLFFRPLFAFFTIELKSRRVIRVEITRSPTDTWVAQQLREATPYGQAPKYLVCENDSKFGPVSPEWRQGAQDLLEVEMDNRRIRSL
jgi:hypothetical protein